MIPLPLNNSMYLNTYNQAVMYQAYQNMMNFNMMSSMMLASQERMLQAQYQSMAQIKQQLLQTNLKSQPIYFTPQTTDSTLSSISPTLTPSSATQNLSIKIDTTEEIQEEKELISKPSQKKKKVIRKRAEKFDKGVLEAMVLELLEILGRTEAISISELRQKYEEKDANMLPVFDVIVSKYQPVKKHREDIIRYIIRKTLKFVKTDVIKKDKLYGKRAYAVLCRKYFHFTSEDLEKAGIDPENEDELIEVLLPYRKNSKNRTMNTNFTAEIFSSKEFCDDYYRFLQEFNPMLDEDNEKKVQKLIALAEECVTKGYTDKIKKCTRLPWLQVWIERTRAVAAELPKLGIKGVGNGEKEEDVKSDVVKKSKTE